MVARHWDPGVLTTSGVHIFSALYYAMHERKFSEMNECDAPESNKTLAGTELTRSLPITVVGSC